MERRSADGRQCGPFSMRILVHGLVLGQAERDQLLQGGVHSAGVQGPRQDAQRRLARRRVFPFEQQLVDHFVERVFTRLRNGKRWNGWQLQLFHVRLSLVFSLTTVQSI